MQNKLPNAYLHHLDRPTLLRYDGIRTEEKKASNLQELINDAAEDSVKYLLSEGYNPATMKLEDARKNIENQLFAVGIDPAEYSPRVRRAFRQARNKAKAGSLEDDGNYGLANMPGGKAMALAITGILMAAGTAGCLGDDLDGSTCQKSKPMEIEQMRKDFDKYENTYVISQGELYPAKVEAFGREYLENWYLQIQGSWQEIRDDSVRAGVQSVIAAIDEERSLTDIMKMEAWDDAKRHIMPVKEPDMTPYLMKGDIMITPGELKEGNFLGIKFVMIDGCHKEYYGGQVML